MKNEDEWLDELFCDVLQNSKIIILFIEVLQIIHRCVVPYRYIFYADNSHGKTNAESFYVEDLKKNWCRKARITSKN